MTDRSIEMLNISKTTPLHGFEWNVVVNDAVIALKKQNPMKIIRYKSHPEDVLLCPVCGSTFVTRLNVDNVMNYCNNCGQRIDVEEMI